MKPLKIKTPHNSGNLDSEANKGNAPLGSLKQEIGDVTPKISDKLKEKPDNNKKPND